MSIHYVSARLENLEIFNEDEVAELTRHAQAHPLEKLLATPRWKEESAIDFTYTSAQIEGNTYSRADTITLLKTGQTAPHGKMWSEAQMILNLRKAYDMVVARASHLVATPLEGARTLHTTLMRGLLEDDELGATRRTRNARIGGSSYVPPDGAPFLDQEAAKIFKQATRVTDPFSASLYVACNLSYLQLFEDGNKRTSRVMQNAMLMASGLPPVLFPVTMTGEYVEAQLGYYETGDYLLHRAFVLEAYRAAYPLAPPVPSAAASLADRLTKDVTSKKPGTFKP